MMSRPRLPAVADVVAWTCRQCRARQQQQSGRSVLQGSSQNRAFSNSQRHRADVEVRAAPELDFGRMDKEPARLLPASPSYFTGTPMFNDDILQLRSLTRQYEKLPTLAPDQVPRIAWMKLAQYRSLVGEEIAAGRYARILGLLKGLNRIPTGLRPSMLVEVMERFRRPGTAEAPRPRQVVIDEYGRAKAIGRRKTSSARVHLVEGSGEILVNGKSIIDAFSRLHDRESALWALKIAQRMDKYNVFAVVSGGGTTGQAEAVTLAIAKALLVHEPALKPLLRRAGCITRDPRKVERKKPGHVKARKMPTWVKR